MRAQIRRNRFAIRLAGVCLIVMTTPTYAANHAVDVGGASLTFAPSQLTITAGDTVTWTNRGGIHNVRSTSGANFRCANGCDGSGGNGDASGASWSFSLTFTTPATINYECEPHGSLGMTGQIVVQPGTTPGEPGQLRLAAANINVQENVGTATVAVRRVGGSSGAVAVSFGTADGSATAGGDYTSASGSLNWADGDTADKTFGVAIINDTQTEGNETVTVSLSNPSGGATLGSPSAGTITILANDQPTAQPGVLAFASATFHGHEEVGAAEVTVNRTSGSDGAVSATWTASAGSATAGLDFVAASGQVAWSAGDSTPKSFLVTLLDDANPETTETVQLALSQPTGGASLGTPAVAELMIMDDDLDSSGPCVADEETLCLGVDGRFRARVNWRTPAQNTGVGAAVPLEGRPDSGLFYFFDSSNIELLLKVLDGCGLNQRYWVFFAATTNVEFTLTVTDTVAEVSKIYVNPLGQTANAVTDTSALGTCP